MTQAALTKREAALYLGLTAGSRWLDRGAAIARVDLRRPGAKRPVWRWLRADLDAFLEARRVEPGAANLQNWG